MVFLFINGGDRDCGKGLFKPCYVQFQKMKSHSLFYSFTVKGH